ncbi:397340c8-e193-4aed-8998-1d033079b3a8 [Sclerotinia trifoliorum]|uniref:397340c8-e193-4aed-8998-1d033079b3a8 n=1 Tax=Sclerotinia trifoliorum TaxID=28548 RepID=A0A8H2ZLX6_9HELO|nr:397340c8-e193-4aed-8998-1d033079b3a8 [Sclerotinia trifoliorum]
MFYAQTNRICGAAYTQIKCLVINSDISCVHNWRIARKTTRSFNGFHFIPELVSRGHSRHDWLSSRSCSVPMAGEEIHIYMHDLSDSLPTARIEGLAFCFRYTFLEVCDPL